jgi:SAM-dependent methyltransferase
VTLFGRSARYYDSLYSDKDYAAEADYVDALIQRWAPGARSLLDLGCGTGRHAFEFARRGYTVFGVDRSAEMLVRAREQRARLPPGLGERLVFAHHDIRGLRLDRAFDCVAALFHVVSYQISNEDVLAAFAAAKAHLRENGLFVFDCWYGPGVFSDPPVRRTKVLRHGEQQLLRIAEPTMHINANLVDVSYQFVVEEGGRAAPSEFGETHRMRYFFAPELALALQMTGFKMAALSEWMSEREPDCQSWNVSVVALSIA